MCIPVDRYSKVEANLQAIHHILEARRVELRQGTLSLVRASFAGFTALPAPTKRTWQEILGIGPGVVPVTAAIIEDQFRRLAKKYHPDAGGSNELMAELNQARAAALREIGS